MINIEKMNEKLNALPKQKREEILTRMAINRGIDPELLLELYEFHNHATLDAMEVSTKMKEEKEQEEQPEETHIKTPQVDDLRESIKVLIDGKRNYKTQIDIEGEFSSKGPITRDEARKLHRAVNEAKERQLKEQEDEER